MNLAQAVMYNGHQRKHAMKFQAVLAPDGLLLHVLGPFVGRSHDWRMYLRSGLEKNMPEVLKLTGSSTVCSETLDTLNGCTYRYHLLVKSFRKPKSVQKSDFEGEGVCGMVIHGGEEVIFYYGIRAEDSHQPDSSG